MDPDVEFLHDFLEIFTSDLSFKMNGENNVYNFQGAKEGMRWSLRTIRRKLPQVIIEDSQATHVPMNRPAPLDKHKLSFKSETAGKRAS